MSKELDVTVLNLTGRPLVDEVIKIVGDTQAFFLQPLPSVIVMTSEQYDSLLDEDELQFMSEYSEILDQVKQSKDKLFYTPHNVMEVRIKGADYDTKTSEDNNVL